MHSSSIWNTIYIYIYIYMYIFMSERMQKNVVLSHGRIRTGFTAANSAFSYFGSITCYANSNMVWLIWRSAKRWDHHRQGNDASINTYFKKYYISNIRNRWVSYCDFQKVIRCGQSDSAEKPMKPETNRRGNHMSPDNLMPCVPSVNSSDVVRMALNWLAKMLKRPVKLTTFSSRI